MHVLMTVTLDTNLFIDKAESRAGAENVDRICELARKGSLALYYTSTTDFETDHPVALGIAIRLLQEGVLHEDRNAGTGLDFMPSGPGLHRVEDETLDELAEKIWPNANVLGFSYESKRRDVCRLLAHKLNKRDIFLTRDNELLAKRSIVLNALGVTIKSPKELLLEVGNIQTPLFNQTAP